MNDRPPDPEAHRDRARREMAVDESRFVGCRSCLEALGRAVAGGALLALVVMWFVR
jgi:hypothetical protein